MLALKQVKYPVLRNLSCNVKDQPFLASEQKKSQYSHVLSSRQC